MGVGKYRRLFGQIQVLLVSTDSSQILLDGVLVLIDAGLALSDGGIDAGEAAGHGGGIAGQSIIGCGSVVIGAFQQGDAGIAHVGHGQSLRQQGLTDRSSSRRIDHFQLHQGYLVGDAVGLHLGAHGQSGVVFGLGRIHGPLRLIDAVGYLIALIFQVRPLLLQVGYLVGQLVHGLLGAVDLLIIIIDGVLHLGDAGFG